MAEYGDVNDGKMAAAGMDRSSKLVDDVMVLNGLHYSLPSELSAAVKRVNRINYADKNIYTNQDNEVLHRINSSNDYHNPENCYLAFDLLLNNIVIPNALGLNNNYVITLGSGGGLSLFQRNITETKSGSQAEYIDDLSVISTQMLYANNSPNYIADMATMAGIACQNTGYPISTQTIQGTGGVTTPTFAFSPVTSGRAVAVPAAGQDFYPDTNVDLVALATVDGVASGANAATAIQRRIVLPLKWLGGIWNNKDTLIPACLGSGLRLRLALQQQLSNIFTIYQVSGAVSAVSPNTWSVGGYTLSNVYIMTDSMELSPMIFRKLTEIAGNSGLDYVYKTYYYQLGTMGTSSSSISSYNMEINRAVSRALAVHYVMQPQNQQLMFGDSNQTDVFKLIQYYSRLGSLNFPAQPLTIIGPTSDTDAQVRSSEFYYQTMEAVKNTCSGQHSCALRFNDFQQGFALISQLLERSSLEYSGLPVNNSRSLASLFTFNTSGGGVGVKDYLRAYLEYVKVLKCFLKEAVPKE